MLHWYTWSLHFAKNINVTGTGSVKAAAAAFSDLTNTQIKYIASLSSTNMSFLLCHMMANFSLIVTLPCSGVRLASNDTNQYTKYTTNEVITNKQLFSKPLRISAPPSSPIQNNFTLQSKFIPIHHTGVTLAMSRGVKLNVHTGHYTQAVL